MRKQQNTTNHPRTRFQGENAPRTSQGSHGGGFERAGRFASHGQGELTGRSHDDARGWGVQGRGWDDDGAHGQGHTVDHDDMRDDVARFNSDFQGDEGRYAPRYEGTGHGAAGARDANYEGQPYGVARGGYRGGMGSGVNRSFGHDDAQANEWAQGQSRNVNRDQFERPAGFANRDGSDERIREDVCDRIGSSVSFDPTDIEVSVQNGEVTLSGTLEDRRSKHELENLAESVPGVKDVHNQIRVTRGSDSDREAASGKDGNGRRNATFTTPSAKHSS